MRFLRTSIVLFLALAATSCVVTQPAQDNDDLVVFTKQLSGKALTISCKPRSEEIGKRGEWVDRCNELGRVALEAAASSGQIAPVTGAAFGMASKFIGQMPASASVSKRAMSREFPLLANAP